MLKNLSIAVLVSFAVACGKDEARLTVAVNGSSFDRLAVPSGGIALASVPFTVINRGRATAFLPTCGPRVSPIVERWTGSTWEQYSAGFCFLDMLTPPIELRDGASHSGELTFGEAGRFRVRARYSKDVTGDPERESYSSPSRSFDVR